MSNYKERRNGKYVRKADRTQQPTKAANSQVETAFKSLSESSLSSFGSDWREYGSKELKERSLHDVEVMRNFEKAAKRINGIIQTGNYESFNDAGAEYLKYTLELSKVTAGAHDWRTDALKGKTQTTARETQAKLAAAVNACKEVQKALSETIKPAVEQAGYELNVSAFGKRGLYIKPKERK